MKFNIEIQLVIITLSQEIAQFKILSTKDGTDEAIFPCCKLDGNVDIQQAAVNLGMQYCNVTEKWIKLQLGYSEVSIKDKDTVVISYNIIVPHSVRKAGFWYELDLNKYNNLLERVMNEYIT